jgi:hypothetical protein
MRGLIWILGIVIVAIGMYGVSPPDWSQAPVEASRTAARTESRSMVVRLAKAGQAMRQREAPPAGPVVATEAAISFDAK